MLSIAYVSTYPPTHCGVAEYTKMLITALRSVTNITVHALCDINGKRETVDKEAGAYIHNVFIKGSSSYDKILDTLAEIGGVDVLHVQHEYGIFGHTDAILEACLKAKEEKLARKIVFTMHTVYHPLSGNDRALKFQEKLNSVDAVIVHSFLKEFELQHQGVSPRIIYRIPHGTHLNPYLEVSRETLLSELSLSREKIKGYIVTMPGFLRKDKGLDVLIDSLKRISREKFTAIIAGELKDKKLLDLIEYAHSKINVIYLERYLLNEEMLKLIALSDIIVLPYKDRRGTYSISGILHLSMGSFRPIIGTKVPRLIELYQYAPRLTIPPKAPEELSRKIMWLIENYDFGVAYMAYLYGYAARTQWLRMARRHVNLYNTILEH